MYKIEEGIPVSTAYAPLFPLADMKVGDSFFVPLDGKVFRGVKEIRARVYYERNRLKDTMPKYGVKTVVITDDRSATGVRVWRSA